MTPTQHFTLDATRLHEAASAGRLGDYDIKDIETFDARELIFNTSTGDEIVGNLLRGAWALGALTGPAEPLITYEQEPDSYHFRFDLGTYGARARLLTDGQEWRRIVEEDTRGVNALASVLEKAVDELNATLTSFDNYLTTRRVA